VLEPPFVVYHLISQEIFAKCQKHLFEDGCDWAGNVKDKHAIHRDWWEKYYERTCISINSDRIMHYGPLEFYETNEPDILRHSYEYFVSNRSDQTKSSDINPMEVM